MVFSKKKADGMRIGIDARMINESGIGRYTRNLLQNLQKIDKKNEYIVFLLGESFESLVFKRNFSKARADFRWYTVSEQLKFPNLLSRYELDLVHFPHFNVPILYRGKFVLTIHDLIHQHFQMRKASSLDPFKYKIKTLGYSLVFNSAVKRAVTIFTPTNFVKEQLISECGLDYGKIVVTPEAVEEKIIRLAGRKSKKIIDGDYLFYVGNVHPHKNMDKVIEAFEVLKIKHPALKLVLSGKNNYFWERLKSRHQTPDIIYTGYVTDEQLVALYKGAQVFVMPSLEEGFGIPVLEAMACDCPVVASDIGAIREVGESGAVYFNPMNTDDIAEKIDQIISDEKLKERLKNEGKKRVGKFSWERMAKQTMEVYLRCG